MRWHPFPSPGLGGCAETRVPTEDVVLNPRLWRERSEVLASQLQELVRNARLRCHLDLLPLGWARNLCLGTLQAPRAPQTHSLAWDSSAVPRSLLRRGRAGSALEDVRTGQQADSAQPTLCTMTREPPPQA